MQGKPLKAESTNLEGKDTRIRLKWSPDFLYVAFVCTDNDVFCTRTRGHDEDLHNEDVCEIFIDGTGDSRQFIEIQTAPSGENLDKIYVYSADVSSGPDGRVLEPIRSRDCWGFLEWDMEGLVTAASTNSAGWCAEMAIPAKFVVKRRGASQFSSGMELRANFVRYDHDMQPSGKRNFVQQNWFPVIVGNPHNSPACMGRLILK